MRRKLKNEEMEKQFDPKTLEKSYNAMERDENIDKEQAVKGKDKEMGPWLVKADVRGGREEMQRWVKLKQRVHLLSAQGPGFDSGFDKGAGRPGIQSKNAKFGERQVQLRPVSACW